MLVRVFSTDNSNVGSWSNMTAAFNVTDNGSARGYTTNVSPWFNIPSALSNAVLGIQVSSPTEKLWRSG